MGWSAGQRLGLQQLEDIAAARPQAFEIIDTSAIGEGDVSMRVEVSIDTSGITHAPGGIRVRARERFVLLVGPRFPYVAPWVWVRHRRWAGTAHVQWGSSLCLYAAPSVEWSPAEGMRGLIERLLLWVEQAAAGQLDPDDRPLHPPATYTGTSGLRIVMRADLGDLVPWRGTADGKAVCLVGDAEIRDRRIDVLAWRQANAQDGDEPDPDRTGRFGHRMQVAAVLVDQLLGFEYPDKAKALAEGLYAAGLQHDDFMQTIAQVAARNALLAEDGHPPPPLIVVVGTPARRLGDGRRLAHLVAWRLDSFAERVADLLARVDALQPLPAIVELRRDVVELGRSWLDFASTDWISVLEDRPEVTLRRDGRSSASSLRGKRILVLGCGAIGAPAAEYCVRAGAAEVTVVDDATVKPGILVRQPYVDDDIGKPKATVLAQRLAGISAETKVNGVHVDAITAYGPAGEQPPVFDVIIDATADSGVRAALESARSTSPGGWPDLITMLVGHQARRGMVAIARREATGGGHDIFRRCGMAVNTTHRLGFADVAADFFPNPSRALTFQPEPGCSAPTFVGSAAEVTALAAMMMSAAIDALADRGPDESRMPMAVAAVRLGADHSDLRASAGTAWLGWPNDTVVTEDADGREIRIAHAAMAEIRAEVRHGARIRPADVETGGMLIGALDDAVGCVFVDAATGPPPDSRMADKYFEHGTQGVQEVVQHHLTRSHGASGFIGMWHSHPCGPAAPSPTDVAGMANLVTPVAGGPPQALMLIAGGPAALWQAWRDERTTLSTGPHLFARLVRRSSRVPMPAPPAPTGLRYFSASVLAPPPPKNRAPWWRRTWWRKEST
ncbi:ThiF family adenylyltransferase [Nucisporomicrobium flavum]|uniref:ThiF family adenylyltransferase n=1 Tax=Nucisporomicrobium flavum TaxID=2785915 RepID=UPI003C2F1A0A